MGARLPFHPFLQGWPGEVEDEAENAVDPSVGRQDLRPPPVAA